MERFENFDPRTFPGRQQSRIIIVPVIFVHKNLTSKGAIDPQRWPFVGKSKPRWYGTLVLLLFLLWAGVRPVSIPPLFAHGPGPRFFEADLVKSGGVRATNFGLSDHLAR